MRRASLIVAISVFLAAGSFGLTDAAANEPFGVTETSAPESSVTWQQWKNIISAAEAELQKLERCRATDQCNTAESKFIALVKEARDKEGLTKIDFVQTSVNRDIHYVADQAQWGVADRWSLPVDTEGRGALNTGVGDCEDFVITKYAVLHQAGIPDKDLRIVLVRDFFVGADHAVLAVQNDHKWLILDNRWDRLYEDKDLRQFKPLMIVDRQGVYSLSKMFRISDTYDP